MRKTLLQMTQEILSDMESDEVNSIADTVESLQVATSIVNTFYYLFSAEVIPGFKGLVKLDPASNVTTPTKMSLPENVKSVDWIKYNFREASDFDYRDVVYIDPEAFIRRSVAKAGQDNTDTFNGPNGTQMVVSTDVGPQYWTTYNNNEVWMDGFNSSIESTLEETNVLCFGQYIPEFELVDESIPTLDPNLFPLLQSEATALCFINYKQASNAKEEEKSRRLKQKNQNDRWRLNQKSPWDRLPDYGRRSTRGA